MKFSAFTVAAAVAATVVPGTRYAVAYAAATAALRTSKICDMSLTHLIFFEQRRCGMCGMCGMRLYIPQHTGHTP